MGFFSALKRAARVVGQAVRSVAAAVVKVGKAVVRVAKEAGKTAVALGRRAKNAIARAVEDLARKAQGKPPAEIERLCRLLDRLLRRVSELRSGDEVADFHAWARLCVLEAVLPPLAAEVAAARSAAEVCADARRIAEEGLGLVDDAANASDEVLNAVENLCLARLGKATDTLALERLIVLFEGDRETTAAQVDDLEASALVHEQHLREAELWARLGKARPGRIEEVQAAQARIARELERARERLGDLELVTWTAEGLYRASLDEGVRDLFVEQLATMEVIVFEFFRAGEDAVLPEEERTRLREAAVIFRGDAERHAAALGEEPVTVAA